MTVTRRFVFARHRNVWKKGGMLVSDFIIQLFRAERDPSSIRPVVAARIYIVHNAQKNPRFLKGLSGGYFFFFVPFNRQSPCARALLARSREERSSSSSTDRRRNECFSRTHNGTKPPSLRIGSVSNPSPNNATSKYFTGWVQRERECCRRPF